MQGTVGVLALGLLLGVRHALDPDHVVAISTMSTRAPSLRGAVGIGAIWGLGHTLTILLIGGTLIAMRIVISPRAGLAMEFSVALMLIGLGIANLVSAIHRKPAAPSPIRPFIIGMVHGMAGSAAVALLVLAAIDEPLLGMVYLGLFGFGTITGMIAATCLMTIPMTMLVDRAAGSRRLLTAVSGLASLLFGAVMVHGLGGSLALLTTQ